MIMHRSISFFPLILLIGLLPASAQTSDSAEGISPDERAAIVEELEALEIASHQWWFESNLEALDALMMGDFYFIAMNGAVETKSEVIGTGSEGEARAPRPLQIAELRVEPETVVVRDGEAVVISTLHIRATVRGRPIPERHRIMSVFLRQGEAWRLFARSITPILAPPGAP
jgi:hypothetical protein